MKRTPLKRKTPLRSRRTALGSTKRTKTKIARPKLPKATTVRNKADALLTPIIKAMFPNCLLRGGSCAGVTQVAHHHVHKSKSSRLRYDLANLINLCGACHVMLHNDESFWGAKVAQLKGPEWFSYIEKAKHETVKVDVHFYLANYERLQEILRQVSQGN